MLFGQWVYDHVKYGMAIVFGSSLTPTYQIKFHTDILLNILRSMNLSHFSQIGLNWRKKSTNQDST